MYDLTSQNLDTLSAELAYRRAVLTGSGARRRDVGPTWWARHHGRRAGRAA
jgi:hypothetical protein